MSQRKYTKTHEWIVKNENGNYRVGISDFAQNSLGDVVYVGIPAVGSAFKISQNCVVIESVKAASDIYAPCSGTIVAVNESLLDNPEKINASPYDQGWIFEMKLDQESELQLLLDEASYQNHIKN
ncbi:MAG: glycine cleavage system protein GcvH [Methylacidiphilales bacterium]|nr:glycine cleavage system protein GcvH [Candidatus Methylacidiphilales bacterium]